MLKRKIACWPKLIGIVFLFYVTLAYAINPSEYFPDLKPDADGRIETLNNEGAMAPVATGAEIWLLSDLKNQDTQKLRILEIGPAYGRLPVELFISGFKGKYTAIDLSADHLAHLKQALTKFQNAVNTVQTITGRFPEATQTLADGSFDIIVVTHVFHFFEPAQFNSSLNELHRLLAKNGRIYLTAKTPYSTRYKKFIPVYEQRLKQGANNPGYIDNVGEWADPSTIAPERLKKLFGRHLYFFTKEDLSKIFKASQFSVARCEEVSLGYSSAIWQAPKEYTNREDVVILAVKR